MARSRTWSEGRSFATAGLILILALAGPAGAGPLMVDPDSLDAGVVAPGESVSKSLVLENAGAQPIQFEFPGFTEARAATNLSIDIDAESFGAFSFRPVAGGRMSGAWTGFSGDLDLLIAAGATWNNDITVLLTSAPELDFATVVYQVGGNAANLAPAGQVFHWSGGVGLNTIAESFIFPDPIVIEGLYAWVGNAWTTGSGQWDGNITLAGLGGQTGLITSIAPTDGELAPGESMTVDAVFEAGNRLPGTYTEALILQTDQAEQPEILIPVSLTVPGLAVLEPLPSTLDFGEIPVGASSTQTLLLQNSGNTALSIEQIAVSDSEFSVNQGSLLIPPASSAVLDLSFEPETPGPVTAALSFVSNDANSPEVSIDLTGLGLPAPAIALDPASVALSLAAGETGSVTFDIVNNGDSALDFSLPRFAEEPTTVTRMAMPQAWPGLSADSLRERLLPRTAGDGQAPRWQPAAPGQTRTGEGYRIEFENFVAAAGEFVLIDGPLSGELSLVIGDFVLDNGTGQTWASDLTLLIATTPTPDLVAGNDVLIQIGGSVTSLAPIIGRWGDGGSGAPGTPVQSAIMAPEPFALEDVYLLLGNSWTAGDGQWSGSIEIIDLDPIGGPITGASPSSGTVAPGDAVSVTLDVSAEGLMQGDYIGLLQILSNDPGQAVSLFELALSVTGTPALQLGVAELDFGELFIGQEGVLELDLANVGTAPVTVSDISVDNPVFGVGFEDVSIEPGVSVQLPVSFSPAAVGTATGSLSFQTDDPEQPIVTVPLTAMVLDSPALLIEPEQIEAALPAGSETQVALTLSNPGTGVLSFEFPAFSTPVGDGQLRVLGGNNEQRVDWLVPTREQALAARASDAQLAERGPESPRGVQASFELVLDAFAADGLVFTQVASGLTGSLERVDADFVLDASTGVTWASDLAVVITDGPDLTAESVLFQAGGTLTLGVNAPRLSWQTGNSSVPGTAVQTSLDVDPAFEFVDAYVWIGNAWLEGDSGQWTGTIGLDGVSDRSPFIIDVSPPSGTIAPGASAEISVSLSAADLNAGFYRDRLALLSNDPIRPELEIEAMLLVSGEPVLEVAPETLDFGEVFVGASATGTVLVSNTGTDILIVDGVEVTGDGFATQAENFSLPPGGSAALLVSFIAESFGDFSGGLALASNATDQPLTVSLTAQARNPGILTLSDSSLTIEVLAGATGAATLTLGNVGESPLAFELMTRRGLPEASSSAAAPALQLAPAEGFVSVLPGRSAPVQAPAQDREVLWEQQPIGSFRITSSRSTELDAGLYAADAFQVDGAALIQGITAYGFRFDGAERFDETFENVVFLIYADDEGRPAGHPDDGLANELFRAEANVGSPGFDVSEQPQWFGLRADVSLDLVEATGQSLLLGEGSYWLLVYAVSASPNLYTDTWEFISSFEGEQIAHVIDPDDVFQIGAQSWKPLASILPAFTSNLSFRLDGRALNFLAVDPVQGVIDVDDSLVLQLLADATDFEPGSYTVDLMISTNSPATPAAVVPVTMVVTAAEPGLDWVNLAGPPAAEIEQGQLVTIHGKARMAMARAGALSDVQMWVGFHDRDIHPAFWPESAWVSGQLHDQSGVEASFIAETGAHLAPGQYFYATRFRLADGSHVFGGYHISGGGFWNGLLHTSGRLTVLPGRQDSLFDDRFQP